MSLYFASQHSLSLTQCLELLHQHVGELHAVFEGDEAVETLALYFVGSAHHSGFCHGRMLHQSRLYLCRAHQVAWRAAKTHKDII